MLRTPRARLIFLSALAALTACPSDTPSDGLGEDGIATVGRGSTGDPGTAPTDDDDDDDPGDTTGAQGDGTGDGGSDSAPVEDPFATSTAGSDSSSGGNDPDAPIPCGGTVYACGDNEDNDGDGLVDLMDPECTGPCDDDEESFQTGISGDNVDCKQDCFFDGNSGQGDDGCNWDLKCDPANPGEGSQSPDCSYVEGHNCGNSSPMQDPECIEFCLPFVPPGCDCFGCCTVTDDEGNEHSIFVNSPDPDCSVNNIEACNTCTPSEDCVNTCDAAECELCFGEQELPPECDENTCDFGDTCATSADCPTGWYCLAQCCYPPPPG